MELEHPADNEASTTEKLIRGSKGRELRLPALELNLRLHVSNSTHSSTKALSGAKGEDSTTAGYVH